MKSGDQLADIALAELRRKRDFPAVKLTEGFFEFFLDGEMVYDFKPEDTGAALRWIEHMAGKSWVTKEHLSQFSMLAANHFGVRYV